MRGCENGWGIIAFEFDGAVAELADAGDLKSPGGDTLWVRPPPALQMKLLGDYPAKIQILERLAKDI